MEFVAWRDKLLTEVNHLADKEFQLRTWFGSEEAEEISSPEEIFEGILGDYDIRAFLKRFGDRLTDDQRRFANELIDVMERGGDVVRTGLRFEEVLADRRWINAMDAAVRLDQSFREQT